MLPTIRCIDETQSFKGRYIRNGIREHAMAAVANGLAAYHPGTFLPTTATFFMFYIYARSYPGVFGGTLTDDSRLPLGSEWVH
jgi:dihydroxyacetone synthase